MTTDDKITGAFAKVRYVVALWGHPLDTSTLAALDLIEGELKATQDQLSLAKAAHGANARVRRRIRRIENHDDAKAVAALARKCSAKTAKIADISRQLAEANERYTRYPDVIVQAFDRCNAALSSVAQDRDRLAKELAALRAGYDSDGGDPMKETL